MQVVGFGDQTPEGWKVYVRRGLGTDYMGRSGLKSAGKNDLIVVDELSERLTTEIDTELLTENMVYAAMGGSASAVQWLDDVGQTANWPSGKAPWNQSPRITQLQNAVELGVATEAEKRELCGLPPVRKKASIDAVYPTDEDAAIAPTFVALWPNRGNAFSTKVEWDEYSEFNYTQIFRSDNWKDFLEMIEKALLHGQRFIDTSGYSPCTSMGGLGKLGLTIDNAQLAFLQVPIKREDGYLTEFSLVKAATKTNQAAR